MPEIIKNLPAPAPFQLPQGIAANDNVERRAAEIAAERWGLNATESAFSKFVSKATPVVGRLFFWASLIDIAPGDTPIRESSPPLLIDQPPFGKTVEQWLREMEEAAQIAAEIYNLQNQIQQLQRQGQGHLALPLQHQLTTLFAQTVTIAKGYDIPVSGAFQMVASAGNSGSTTSTHPALADEIDKSLGDVPFTTFNGEEDYIPKFNGDLKETQRRLQDIARGDRCYPRLELLLKTLLRGKANPVIFEYGPGTVADLAVTVARHYPITLVDRVNYYPHRLVRTLPTHIQERIHFTTLDGAPTTLTDLAFWIHPDPHMAYRENYLDPREMGANVAPGGYLVVQTESDGLHYGFRPTPGWSLITKFDGEIAPTLFRDLHNDVYIFQRDPILTIPTHESIAAILQGNPSATGPFGMGYIYDLPYVVSGETRYPRLEALVAQLLANKASPQIVERGAGEFAALSVTLARLYPHITVIERLKDVRPNFDGVPLQLRNKIRLLDIYEVPTVPFADLAFWIHPIPYIMTERDAQTLNLSLLGQDVVDGGYLVVQTEVDYVVPQSPGWKLIYGGRNVGFLAPSKFANASAHTIVLQKIPQSTPDDWLTLMEVDPNTFVQRAYEKIEALKAELTARLARGENASIIKAWYQRNVLPEISMINGLIKTHIPQEVPYSAFRTLNHALEFWCTTIPMHLEYGDIDSLKAFTDSLPK